MMRTHYIASATLYMTADRCRVVREDDPAAEMPGASRLVSEGQTLPASTVERFGLITRAGYVIGIPNAPDAPATPPRTPVETPEVPSPSIDAPDSESAVEAKVITPSPRRKRSR